MTIQMKFTPAKFLSKWTIDMGEVLKYYMQFTKYLIEYTYIWRLQLSKQDMVSNTHDGLVNYFWCIFKTAVLK